MGVGVQLMARVLLRSRAEILNFEPEELQRMPQHGEGLIAFLLNTKGSDQFYDLLWFLTY